MKKLAIILLCFVSIPAFSQVDLQIANYRLDANYSYPVIVPSLPNLIAIVNMDVQTFKATMTKYKYHPDKEVSGPAYIYTNENLDFYLDGNDGKGVNRILFDPTAGNNRFAGFQIVAKQAFPDNCIQDLYQELAPYYTKTDNGIRKYVFTLGGYNYGVSMIPMSNYYGTIVQMYKFGK